MVVGFSGPTLEAGALTVDLEAASRAFEQLLKISWIKESVNDIFIMYMFLNQNLMHLVSRLFSLQMNLTRMIDTLIVLRGVLRSPEIILILLMCPFLQEDFSLMSEVLSLALVITRLNERCLNALGKQTNHILSFEPTEDMTVVYEVSALEFTVVFWFCRKLLVFSDPLHTTEAHHAFQKCARLHTKKWSLSNSRSRCEKPTGGPQAAL